MVQNLTVNIYRTDLEYVPSGLDDPEAIEVALTVSSVWNSTGDPDVVYDDVLKKLVANYTVSSKISLRARYRFVPDGMGGYKRVRWIGKSIMVSTTTGVGVSVDMSWDEDQGPPPS